MTIETLNEILEYLETGFTVSSLIVRSGQRVVYHAHAANGERCVLKTSSVLPIEVARVQREIKILTELKSDFFPRVHHHGFVTQETLRNFIDDLDPKTEQSKISTLTAQHLAPFFLTVETYIEHMAWDDCKKHLQDETKAIQFLRTLFEALELLWKKQIVHRDLKPANIMVRPNLKPVVIDLGIAKSFNAGTLALTHAMFRSPCTPQFAAPEQLFDAKAEVHYRTDQFAVGVIIFEALSGKFPFGAISEIGVDAMMKNMIDESMLDMRTLNPKISEGLANFIERLLSVKPYQRFRTTTDIFSGLDKVEKSL